MHHKATGRKKNRCQIVTSLQIHFCNYLKTSLFALNISYLKEIAVLCGIEKNLTYHLARHTFATTITLANGVPIETVSKILGHTSIKTTQIYARITDTKIGHDMGRLAEKLNHRTAKVI